MGIITELLCCKEARDGVAVGIQASRPAVQGNGQNQRSTPAARNAGRGELAGLEVRE
jgi:hypothetical protein